MTTFRDGLGREVGGGSGGRVIRLPVANSC